MKRFIGRSTENESFNFLELPLYNMPMNLEEEATEKKALAINLDPSIYGTFAEIGAGQEVARQFFQAGRASNTIAKTISAYDMTISDEIYGKTDRYVCQERLIKMLNREYNRLVDQLGPIRGDKTRFFSFADTVTTGSRKRGQTGSHGWLGIRFQLRPNGPINEVVMHVRLWDQFRLQQQEALGALGVNLIHACFYHSGSMQEFIRSLLDNLNNRRIEVDLIRFDGLDLNHVDNRLLSLELVKQRLTEAVMFGADGEVKLMADELYGRPAVVMRGTFRPITKTNIKIIEKGLEQFKRTVSDEPNPIVLLEMTMHNLLSESGDIDSQDFLDRVHTACAMGYNVLISNFFLFYQVKSYIRTCTHETIAMVIGASLLEKLFDQQYYENLRGGVLEAFGRLFDSKSKLFVYPFKSDTLCTTAQTFFPEKKIASLYRYLLENQMIVDISNCDDVDTSVHSEDVREMLHSRDNHWKELVPDKVARLIEKRKLFGYKPE